MFSVSELSQWESGIYRLEETDPIKGGEDGVDNLPHKQLANRTKWLKSVADEVIAARGAYASMSAKLASFGVVDPAEFEATYAMHMGLIDSVGQATQEIRNIVSRRMQSGQVTFVNRGVIRGCDITKSVTANRNLHLAEGRIFVQGRIYGVEPANNAASVPQNSTGFAATCFAYMYQQANGIWRLACTQLGDAAPVGSVKLARLVVPANNTDATDAHLANVTVILDSTARRVEPRYPQLVSAAPYFYQAINAFPHNQYNLYFDIVSAVGAPCSPDNVVVTSRAYNGFGILINSAADDIVLRWYAVGKY